MRRGDWRRWKRILAIVYIPLIALGIYGYFSGISATLILGLLALLYTPAFEDRPASTFWFGWSALVFTALFFLVPAKTVVYVALICAVCFYRESFFRRV